MQYLVKALQCLFTLVMLESSLSAQKDTVMIPMTFELGEVKITARAKNVGTSEVVNREMQQFDRKNVGDALRLMPGISYINSGMRNETMIMVRGFDLRQVPVYLDGIPVYITYDGYIDLGNFLVHDINKVAVSKGVSSILFGPNTLGGAINLVTRKPENKLELEGSNGLHAGRRGVYGWRSDLHAGSKLNKLYFQAGYSLVDHDSYSLSDKYEPAYPGNDKILDNSGRRNMKLNFKTGWMPNNTDEYALGFMTQKANKGVPAYAGSDPDQRVRYWRFPEVSNKGVHFISRTALGSGGYLKTRLFYDRYYSDLRSYDDSSLTTRDRRSSFTSIYFDDSYGGSIEYNLGNTGKHSLKGAFHYKYDHHREHNTHPVEETVRHMEDQFITLGLEENYNLSQNVLVIAGISYNYRDNIRADNYDASSDSLFPFPPSRDAALNAQAGLDWHIGDGQDIRVSLARKTRFGTMKDRYSYRLGKSLPNPELKSESAFHTDLSYSFQSAGIIGLDVSLFNSLLRDAIQPVYGVDPGNSAVYRLQNTGRAVFYGFEADIAFMPAVSWQTGLQYTFLERKNLSQPDLLFTDVPRHRLFGYVKYEKPDLFYVIVNSGYNSERPTTSDGEYVADAFFLTGIKASVRVWKGISLEAGIKNLFDANYSYYEGYPEEGRNFNLSLRYVFMQSSG